MMKTRFAPSPTGDLHIGSVRTALFAYLFAKSQNGQFVLRIEDTDRERSTNAATQIILDGLTWLGLNSDEPVVFQSQRFARYEAVVSNLIEQGLAYRCDCSKERLDELRQAQMSQKQKPKYDARCRERALSSDLAHVVRFKTPVEGEVHFHDAVYGAITVLNQELDDLILLRSDGTPTYNLTATVDDMDMGMTHIIRGDDHLNNTPRQINLLKALNAPIPQYAHLPMILNSKGHKLSKRDGAVSVLSYREQGILPEALLNYLVRLGWSHGNEEIFSLEALKKCFDLEHIHRSPAAFSQDKLLWFNQHYIKHIKPEALMVALMPHLTSLGAVDVEHDKLLSAIDVLRPRAKTLYEMAEKALFLFKETVDYDQESYQNYFSSTVLQAFDALIKELPELDWQPSEISALIKSQVKAHGLRFPDLAQPLRVALTGSTVSPSIDETIGLLGCELTLARLRQAKTYFDKA